MLRNTVSSITFCLKNHATFITTRMRCQEGADLHNNPNGRETSHKHTNVCEANLASSPHHIKSMSQWCTQAARRGRKLERERDKIIYGGWRNNWGSTHPHRRFEGVISSRAFQHFFFIETTWISLCSNVWLELGWLAAVGDCDLPSSASHHSQWPEPWLRSQMQAVPSRCSSLSLSFHIKYDTIAMSFIWPTSRFHNN